MFQFSQRTLVAASLTVGLAALALLFARQRIATTLENEAAARHAEIAGLRAIQTPALMNPVAPAQTLHFRTASELLEKGLFGKFGWSRSFHTDLRTEIADLADALGLSISQKENLQTAAAQAWLDVGAAAIASALVTRHENAVPTGAPESPEERRERSQRMSTAGPEARREMVAQSISRESAARGEREIVIVVPESPEARAAVEQMHTEFAAIMGPDVYAFYHAAGAAAAVESYLADVGLEPHTVVVMSAPPGTLSRQLLQRAQSSSPMGARARSELEAARLAPPGNLRRYSAFRIISPKTGVRAIRMPGGLATFTTSGGGPSWSGPDSVTLEELQIFLGPLRLMVPEDF